MVGAGAVGGGAVAFSAHGAQYGLPSTLKNWPPASGVSQDVHVKHGLCHFFPMAVRITAPTAGLPHLAHASRHEMQ